MPTIVEIKKQPWMALAHGRGKSFNIFNPTNGVANVDIHMNVLKPGVKKGAIHYHEKIEDFYIILEGKALITDADGKEYRAKAGQAVFLKPGKGVDTHEVFNVGKGPLKLIEIYAPPQPKEAYTKEFDPSKRDHHIVKTVE